MNETLKTLLTVIITVSATTVVIWLVAKKIGDTLFKTSLKKCEQYLDNLKLVYEVQYKKRNTKESEAIQLIYEHFTKLIGFILREILSGDETFKITYLKPWDILIMLKDRRNSFMDFYEPNRIYLPTLLSKKMIPVVHL